MQLSQNRQQIEIGFIILHYLSIEDTISCVNSILALDSSDSMMIYVVDNASPNQSGFMLKEQFAQYINVHLLLLDQNYGFSHANNVALRMMLEQYEPQYVVTANNDVVFSQSDLLQKLNQEYKISQFFVLGPNVQTSSGRRQSPISLKPRTKEEVSKLIRNISLQIKLIDLFLLYYDFLYYWKKIRRIAFKKFNFEKAKENKINKEIKQYNVCLCGTCLVFSKDYLSYYSQLFYPETFFYHEEDILFYKLNKNQQLSVYTPDISVIHNNAVATKMAFKKRKERMLFQLKNNLSSLKIYHDFIWDIQSTENERVPQ